MDEDFITPVENEGVNGWGDPVTLGDIVTKGAHWNFTIMELAFILDQIEAIIRAAGLRDER